MPSQDLKHKPLVEAIFEMKWALSSPADGSTEDPHIKLLLGRLYDRVSTEYPHFEQLPTASFPEGFLGQIAQYRFRAREAGWPLIQLGPGVLTLNDTDTYTWLDFRERSLSAVIKLFESHPKRQEMRIESVLLRYINSVEFDYTQQSLFSFLESKMKVVVALPGRLFERQEIEPRPDHFVWQASFPCGSPKGLVTVGFAAGERENRRALIWETVVQSAEEAVPDLPQAFDAWIDAAHEITDDWFFKLIEGDLERQFSGD